MRRSSIGRHALTLVLAFTLLTAACGSDSDSPTSPTPATTTETFSGTVDYLGTAGNSFTVGTSGVVTITLTAVAPLATMSVGVGIGSWDGTTCGPSVTKNDNARAGIAALTGTATAGNYCVNVYDSGNVSEGAQITYEIQVTHP